MKVRGRLIVVGVLAAGFVALVVIGSRDKAPLDPDSTEPDGAKGLVLLLGEFAGGVEVLSELPDDDVDVAVLLRDELSFRAAAALEGWVAQGGTLVVADPDSTFVPEIDAVTPALGELTEGTCTIDALASARSLSVEAFVRFGTDEAEGSCFGTAESAFVVTASVGQGAYVAVGGAGLFTNARLDEADNAVLAVALAAPTRETDVAVLRRRIAAPAVGDGTTVDIPEDSERRDVGGGQESLFGLMPDYLRWVALTLAIAWLVYAVARARRLGRPVAEPQPVRIAGSELVRATGRLLRKADGADTARHLVTTTHHELADGLGLPRSVPVAQLAEVAAARCDLDALEIARALAPTQHLDDAGLVVLTRRLDHIRQEVLDVRHV